MIHIYLMKIKIYHLKKFLFKSDEKETYSSATSDMIEHNLFFSSDFFFFFLIILLNILNFKLYTLYPVSCILYPVSCILYPVSCILYPVSCILPDNGTVFINHLLGCFRIRYNYFSSKIYKFIF